MYNYYEEVKESVINYIEENKELLLDTFEDKDELEQFLNNELFTSDSVTGNASGSFTFNRWTAQEYVTENIDLLKEACEELGTDAETVGNWFLSEEWETMDVAIRCYVLGSAISDALEEIELF